MKGVKIDWGLVIASIIMFPVCLLMQLAKMASKQ